MFGNLGMSEIMVIAIIALIVLGPEKFPEYAKIAMRAYRDFRGYIDDIKREMGEELKPVKDEIRELARHNPEEYVEDLAKAISAIDDGPKPAVAASDAGSVEASPYPDGEAAVESTEEAATIPEGATPAEPAVETAPVAVSIETPERLDG